MLFRSGLDYMLFHNLYYLLNTQSTNFSGNYPDAFTSCDFDILGVPPIGSTLLPKFVTITSTHINANNLNVDNLTENCITNNTFYGDVKITGGAYGVTLTNTTVNQGGRLHVSCLSTPNCTINPDDYTFDPAWYIRANTNNNGRSEERRVGKECRL